MLFDVLVDVDSKLRIKKLKRGDPANWQAIGLQNRGSRFESLSPCYATVTQLIECFSCKEDAVGLIPTGSSIDK